MRQRKGNRCKVPLFTYPSLLEKACLKYHKNIFISRIYKSSCLFSLDCPREVTLIAARMSAAFSLAYLAAHAEAFVHVRPFEHLHLARHGGTPRPKPYSLLRRRAVSRIRYMRIALPGQAGHYGPPRPDPSFTFRFSSTLSLFIAPVGQLFRRACSCIRSSRCAARAGLQSPHKACHREGWSPLAMQTLMHSPQRGPGTRLRGERRAALSRMGLGPFCTPQPQRPALPPRPTRASILRFFQIYPGCLFPRSLRQRPRCRFCCLMPPKLPEMSMNFPSFPCL